MQRAIQPLKGFYHTVVGQTANPFVDSLRLGLLWPSLVGFTGGNFVSLAHVIAYALHFRLR